MVTEAYLILEQAQEVSGVRMVFMLVWLIASLMVRGATGLLAKDRHIAPPRRFGLASGYGTTPSTW